MSTDTTARERRPAAAPPPPAALASRVVSTEAELDALAPAWTALHAASGASVFQSFEWQRAWWRHFGEGARRRALHVVVVADGDRAVGIAPFCVDRVPSLGPFPLRRLAFLGTGLTDYLDVLAEPGREGAVLEAVADHLAARGSGWDVVSLTDVPDRSPVHEGLRAALERRGLECARFVVERCPRTHLGASWKETLDAFDGSHRRQLQKRRRQLGERFAVALEVCPGGEALARDVDEFIAMHQRRWTSVGKKGVYADERAAAFQRDVARAFAARGWLFLAFLRLDGKRASALCGFVHGGELAYYLNGTADLGEAARYSPGLVLHALCMEEMIARGVREYDFLRGTERYKYECGAVDVPNWGLLAFRRGAPVARAKNAAALLRESLARRLEAERLAFEHARGRHGLLAPATAGYVLRRLWTVLRDGLRKLRAPEKSLTVDARR